MMKLGTFLGHASPGNANRYIKAVPELPTRSGYRDCSRLLPKSASERLGRRPTVHSRTVSVFCGLGEDRIRLTPRHFIAETGNGL